MSHYILYNDDMPVASFTVRNTVVEEFTPQKPELLPMQIRCASAEGFTVWLRERSVDLSNVQHRNLMNSLYTSRDKTTLALQTHMFSISDTFTCFAENEFTSLRDAQIHIAFEGDAALAEYLAPGKQHDAAAFIAALCNRGIDGIPTIRNAVRNSTKIGNRIFHLAENRLMDIAQDCFDPL